MISGSEIKDILYEVVKSDPVLGVIPEIAKDVHAPVKEGSAGERVVIVLPGGVDNGQFSRSFPRVCIYVPDCVSAGSTTLAGSTTGTYYRPDGARLKAIENHCIERFRSSVYGSRNGNVYLFGIDEIETEDDPETWSHFLNMRLRFETVNTKL